MQLLSYPLSILVTEDRNRPADPPGDHLVSRPVTKFNGQPSLPVLLVTEYHRLQRITVVKIAGYRENKWFLCQMTSQIAFRRRTDVGYWSHGRHILPTLGRSWADVGPTLACQPTLGLDVYILPTFGQRWIFIQDGGKQ